MSKPESKCVCGQVGSHICTASVKPALKPLPPVKDPGKFTSKTIHESVEYGRDNDWNVDEVEIK